MSKWIKFGEQYILNPDKIKYFYIEDNKKKITVTFNDDEELILKPDEEIETVKAWKDILDTFNIDPPYWVYQIINGFDVKIEDL